MTISILYISWWQGSCWKLLPERGTLFYLSTAAPFWNFAYNDHISWYFTDLTNYDCRYPDLNMSRKSSTLLALFKFRSPSKFSVTLLCQQPSRQKFRLKTFTWRSRIFNISVIDCEKASRKILSYTHRRRLNSLSKLFNEYTIALLALLGKANFTGANIFGSLLFLQSCKHGAS